MLLMKYLTTNLVALNLKIIPAQSNNQLKKGVNTIMGMTELLVIGFLVMLGFLAYSNSRKVSRELKKMGAGK